MTSNNRPGRVRGDAVHALEPLAPLVGVHPGEDDGGLLLGVAPLAREVGDLLRGALEVVLGGGDDDDERLVRRVHDVLEVVRVELDRTRKAIPDELLAAHNVFVKFRGNAQETRRERTQSISASRSCALEIGRERV